MKLFRKKILKLGNKGMSMVELICGITMLSVIGTSISGVLMVSADAYNRGTSEASVQQEAQMVANQINDLLIDATSEVEFSSPTLTIVQGDKMYTVTHDAATQELWYTESDLDASGNVISSTDPQLMAEGVETFFVDVSSYERNGHARLDIDFVNSNQDYPSVFSVTARNKEAGDETAVVANINLPTEIILEPNEDYTLAATVTGLANTSLDWELVNATEGSGTKITDYGSSAILEVGSNETQNMFRVLVKSEQLDEDGNPMAQKYVNVYVRRVTDMEITDQLRAGIAFTDTAEYRLTAMLVGNNLPQWSIEGTSGIDPYVDPYTVSWDIIEGDDLCHITGSGITATVSLDANMDGGDKIVVRATAQHPEGVNKSGAPYGNAPVTQEWVLKKSAKFITEGGGWMRQTNQPQASVPDAIQGLRDSVLAGSGYSSATWVFEFRYKPTSQEEWEGADTYEDGWHPNIYGGDSDGSMSINLRPLFTSTMDYRLDYNVEIRVRIVAPDGTELWPTRAVGDSTDTNVVANVVKRVQLTFDSEALGLEAALGNSESSAPDVAFDQYANTVEVLKIHEVIGIDTNGTAVDNSFVYTLEKKVDGAWVAVTNNLNITSQGTGTYNLGFRNADFEGLYRVKVGLKNMPQYDVNNNFSKYIDYILWDEETGEGIYYFNAVKK